MAEIRRLEHPAAAEILELAVTQAEADGTGQIAKGAGIALVSAINGGGRPSPGTPPPAPAGRSASRR